MARKKPLNLMSARFAVARRKIADEVIDAKPGNREIDLVSAYLLSTRFQGTYVTLYFPHWQSIGKVRRAIGRYANDRTRRRPLNILMQAEPGSGKSHLVRSIAKSLESSNAVAIDYNMASLQSIEDLLPP